MHKLKLNPAHEAISDALRLGFRGLISHPPNRGVISAWCESRVSGTVPEIKVCCQALLRLKPSSSPEQLHVGLSIMRFLQRVSDLEAVAEIMGYMKSTFDKFLVQVGRTGLTTLTGMGVLWPKSCSGAGCVWEGASCP